MIVRYTKVILAVLLLVPTISLAGWRDVLDATDRVNKLVVDRPAPAPPAEAESNDDAPPPRNEPPRAAPRAGDDAHFIQPDDYFISKEELGDNSYIYVYLAKMLAKPSSSTKDEGEFMKVHDGQNQWTNIYWQSRIASRDELKLGMHFIAFHDNNTHGIYQAPKKKDRARGGTWWYAKITDMSDMYKGFVTVSGNYKVGLNNIRIPIIPTR